MPHKQNGGGCSARSLCVNPIKYLYKPFCFGEGFSVYPLICDCYIYSRLRS